MTLLARLTRESLKYRSRMIVSRLLRSDATLDAAELLGSPLGTQTWVAFKDIAAELANAQFDSEFQVTGRDGGEVVFRRTLKGVVIRDGESAGEVIWELGLLDPSITVRLVALDTFVESAMPVLPGELRWRSLLNVRPLTPLELDRFVVDVQSAAGPKLQGMSEAFQASDKVTIEGLVPTGRAYYESLIGSVPPAELSAQEYLSQTLYPHLRSIIARDKLWGWFCSQAAFVGPTTDLNEVFREESDESVLSVTNDFVPFSPLAYVAKISVALPRAAASPALLAMAQSAMEALIDASQRDSKSRGQEALFPGLAGLVLSCINTDEDILAAPAYWRRLAAFAHANMLLHFLDFSGVDHSEFENWLSAAGLQLGHIQTYLDAWVEPSWQPESDYLFAPWVAAVGFAISICADAPNGPVIFGTAQKERLDVPPGMAGFAHVFSASPDLLGGRLRACDHEDVNMSADVEASLLTVAADQDRHGSLLTLLLHARQKRFPNSLRTKLFERVREFPRESADDSTQALVHLCVAARIAAVQPDTEFADAVAQVTLELAERDVSARGASLAWLCLISAGGAFVDSGQRNEWMERNLLALALTLPKGAPCVDLAGRIGLMQQLESVIERRYARARYAALSAVS